MNKPLRLGIVGYGKIAQDEHRPAIDSNPDVVLVAIATRADGDFGLPTYRAVTDMVAAHPDLDAVVMCQPPLARYEAASEALRAGKHVFLEKPPGLSVAHVNDLSALAQQQGVTLYASWHSRHARYVGFAKQWCAERSLHSITINWKEDVRHWHPGQQWIWEKGGFGVFDPGINALSILTEILPEPVELLDASLETPSNCAMPIAAELVMKTKADIPIAASFDFRQTGPQSWDMIFQAEGEQLCLGHGGNSLSLESNGDIADIDGEYAAMYRHFVSLVRGKKSDVDCAPLQIAEDALRTGRVTLVEPFYE